MSFSNNMRQTIFYEIRVEVDPICTVQRKSNLVNPETRLNEPPALHFTGGQLIPIFC